MISFFPLALKPHGQWGGGLLGLVRREEPYIVVFERCIFCSEHIKLAFLNRVGSSGP